MKKQLTLLFVFALLLAMTGCSAANIARKLDVAEDRAEARLDAAEEKLEDSLRKAVSESPQRLTKEQAQQIALDHLGLSADQVTRLHTEYEIDDGIPRFDIQFHQGDWEHAFEIHAKTGEIISYDKERL